MQKLLLPLDNVILTAGYQNQAYRNRFGFAHFGHDMVAADGKRAIHGSGQGKVLAAGPDSTLGNVLIVLYPQVSTVATPEGRDLVLRYYHLASIALKPGDQVDLTTTLGVYGNTGRYSAGAHLHVETDFDTRYYAYSPTVGKDGTFIKAGNAKTVSNPSQVLFVGKNQRLAASKASFDGIAYVAAVDMAPGLPSQGGQRTP